MRCLSVAMSTVGTSASSEATLEYGISQQVGYFAFTTVYARPNWRLSFSRKFRRKIPCPVRCLSTDLP